MITKVQSFILLNIKTVSLDLGGNEIVTIHSKAFWTSESNNKTTHTELKYLYLYNNNIKYIKSGTFDPLINLEKLHVYNNKISNIDNTFIVNLNKLEYFRIDNNELTQLPTKWLPNNLIYLDISANSIEYVSINTFEGVFNLSEIWLSPNTITIENNTFINHTKLTIGVNTLHLYICTCKYIWFLNTKNNSIVCDNSKNNYTSTREYLTEECKDYIPG